MTTSPATSVTSVLSSTAQKSDVSSLAVPSSGSALAYEVVRLPGNATDAERMQAVGTDLSQYQWVYDRPAFSPLLTKQSRSVYRSIWGTFTKRLTGQIPDPVMMTHIVTTRCNYSCGFCSFADTLNSVSDELSLEEIEKTYATIGELLNVIIYSGGETTVHRQLPEIIEAAYRLTSVKSVYIISNAWKPDLLFEITHRVMQTCPDLHLTWSLSIEGPKALNNAVRYTKKAGWDAWQNTIDTMWGLKELRKTFGYQQLDVQLCTVCTPDNAHSLSDWYEMVRDVLQPDKWNLNLMRRSVQMSDHDMKTWAQRRQQAQPEVFEQTYHALTERVRQDVIAGRLKFLYHTNNPYDGALKSAVDLMSQADNRGVIQGQPPQIPCRAGTSGAYIGSNGVVSGCEEFANNPHSPKAYGNLRDVGYDFQALWHGKTAQVLRQQTGCASECYGCTLESQKNYPSVLVSFHQLWRAAQLATSIS